jgi:hypothetical protein
MIHEGDVQQAVPTEEKGTEEDNEKIGEADEDLDEDMIEGDEEEIADGSPSDEVASTPPSQPELEPQRKRSKTTNLPCSICQRRQSRRGCSQMACATCCTDQNNCVAHKEARDKLLWKQQILDGTTTTNRLAQEMRQRKLPNKQFREPGFCYLGDTVLIWSLKEFEKRTLWKEEAIRKSERRRRYQIQPSAVTATTGPAAATPVGKKSTSIPNHGESRQTDEQISKKKRKFHQIVEMLHHQVSH